VAAVQRTYSHTTSNKKKFLLNTKCFFIVSPALRSLASYSVGSEFKTKNRIVTCRGGGGTRVTKITGSRLDVWIY
jgi:hypothetical protein